MASAQKPESTVMLCSDTEIRSFSGSILLKLTKCNSDTEVSIVLLALLGGPVCIALLMESFGLMGYCRYECAAVLQCAE